MKSTIIPVMVKRAPVRVTGHDGKPVIHRRANVLRFVEPAVVGIDAMLESVRRMSQHLPSKQRQSLERAFLA